MPPEKNIVKVMSSMMGFWNMTVRRERKYAPSEVSVICKIKLMTSTNIVFR